MSIHWHFPSDEPIISPGQLHDELDTRRAGAAHVLEVDGEYWMYYWGTGSDGLNRILRATASVDRPTEWQPQGVVLERQPDAPYNAVGPSFPWVVPRKDKPWLMVFCGWGNPRPDGKLPNTTGVAFSEDGGLSFRPALDHPALTLDREYNREGTGSVCVIDDSGTLRMYYTSLGAYFQKPEGVKTGHGDTIPRIGVAYAESDDGLAWEKPLDRLLVEPRGHATEPYEYICSKPFILQESDGYRMWVHTFGTAYRVRSLTSNDGFEWTWIESGPEGEFGTGLEGAFDDRQRCYVSIVKHEDEYRCWFTGNGFGQTGMGYAVGHRR